MFLRFFLMLKEARLPVSMREYLTLIETVDAGLADYDIDHFYFLARAALVKDERHLDRFDQIFAHAFKGLEAPGGAAADPALAARDLPEEWLRKLAEKHLSPEERAEVEALGGWEKLMETLKKRLEEQQGRHQGGSKWIGTAGTSPFGAYGYNPEGVRIGQDGSRHRRAVKVWDKREFRNLRDDVELGVRSIKVALKRLRRWAREGAADEFDLDGTIRETARGGMLDIQMRPERRNKVKVLLFMDIGGSMDDHVKIAEELFSAAKSEFKTFHSFYFHNCLYEGVWTDNKRRWDEQTPTWDLLHRFNSEYKCVFVGDAAMSPYEIMQPGGAVEHWNQEAGAAWLQRAFTQWPRSVWLNPTREEYWRYTPSTEMIRKLIEGRMFPTTIKGLDEAMRALS
ncbi:MAG: VWA domain-containing protein [Pseudomonadota bacterium]